MILSQSELKSLVQCEHACPHQLLGMHPLGGQAGLVVRACIPNAQAVSIEPVHEKKKPSVSLKKIHACGLFEAKIPRVKKVYAYDVVVTYDNGSVTRSRDPYSFLPTIEESDLYLFGKGEEFKIYDKLGAQLREIDGVPGTSFAVWAPNARQISVVGDFNHWDGRRHAMRFLGNSGVWEIFIPGVGVGAHYKFEIKEANGRLALKTDPYGFFYEIAPKTASIVWNTRQFEWSDQEWLDKRAQCNALEQPLSIYEVHLGSWKKKKSGSESPNYRELAKPLIDYVLDLGFTHVEFLPVAEHAYYPSWGYQVTGFYAPTSRFGTPEDFQFLINALHNAGIGVIIDWVPAHFPRDDWALARFDGTALYEHQDPRKGEHQDWGTLIFNYDRNEVNNFLIANALFWADRFHVDGLRVDAVASMLYLDYSRNEGEWIPNQYGGRENLEAVALLKKFNHLVQTQYPGVMTIAEESTAWPQVTRPPYIGGLGFTFKWNMGWMHDTLDYFQLDPVHRKFHQNQLTFAMLYHYHENFILPLSHDEVVHGKGSLLGRMPGDDWQRFANLRCLLAYQWLFVGKQLLFMGGEIGQSSEWNENASVDWSLLKQGDFHLGTQQLVRDLNRVYRSHPALWQSDFKPEGFAWIDCSDHENSVLSFQRIDASQTNRVIVVMNLTPVVRSPYRLGVPLEGFYREVINTDAVGYGGSNVGNMGGLASIPEKAHGMNHSILATLPPLGVIAFSYEPQNESKT